MSLRKKKFPWDKSEYFVDEEHKEVWLRGSLSRAWARKGLKEQYGYTFLLASQEFLDRLHSEGPSIIEDTHHGQQRNG